MKGYVYLIKFAQNLHNANYYLGWSLYHPKYRYKEHKSNQGAKILAALNNLGIDYFIVRIWKNQDRKFERKLKNWKKSRQFDKNLTHLPIN